MQAFATPAACPRAIKAASPPSAPVAAVQRVASSSSPKTLRPSAACGTQGAGVAFAALAAVGASRGPRRQRKHVAKATRQLTKIKVAAMQHASGKKPKVVVLGSGWGCASLMEGLTEEEAQMYDITVVSPRNHFLYTPLLPTATMGSIEERSIVTPIREILAGKAEFLEAKCEHVDPAAKKIRCGRAGLQEKRNSMLYDRFPEGAVEGKLSFELDYDILVYSIGAVPNDFNCPGVSDHAFQFKEVEDARNIRNKISDVFEKAALPMTTPEERDALLSFIIVGGGPTGVEVAADLCDFIRDDVGKLYPKLVDHVSVRIIDTVEHLLSSYDRKISEDTQRIFKENGVEVLKGVFVKEITATHVKTARKDDGKLEDLPYGCIVWCTGIKQNKLSVQLKKSITEMNSDKPELDLETLQENNLGLVTDEWLQVKGSFGSIFALGDAAAVQLQRVTRIAEELFAEGDVDGGGTLCVDEMKALFKKKADVYPQLAEYAEYFDTKTSEAEPDTVRLAVQDVFERAGQLRTAAKDMVQARASAKTLAQGEAAIEKQLQQVDIDGNMELDADEFKDLLRGIDRNLRSFPATAQVAVRLLQHGARLQPGSRSVGLHYMTLLQPAGPKATLAMDNFVESVLVYETCFAEILVTLDYGVHLDDDINAQTKLPGVALQLLKDSPAAAQFFCDMREHTRHLAHRLEQRCGGKVSAEVQVLDTSLPHVRNASLRIFGKDLPQRMFKNSFAYLYAPAVMKSDYIAHVDDDIVIHRKGPPGTFLQQALQVLDSSDLASVSMPCCRCPEMNSFHSRMTELPDSRSSKFSRLAVGQMYYKSVRPDNSWTVPGFDLRRCDAMHNFITMQSYVLHAQRFRGLFPMRVEGGADPAELHIECMIVEAALMTSPPTLFGWISDGASQCRDLRNGKLAEHHDVHPSAALSRCLASPVAEAAAVAM